jgi:AraC family transcriptional regulator, transcriptional activator FtrA
MTKKRHLVVALAYNGLCTFEFGCAVEVFALERPELDVGWYDFAVAAVDAGPMQAAGGVTFHSNHGLALLDRADTIIIPGWRKLDEAPPVHLLKKLRRAHERGVRLCSICSGVFLLAAAGVLDGKRVTTHWRYADSLASRYPELLVEPNALYVDEGQILTSAGSAAGLDMLLHVVRTDFGAKVANMVAQRLVLAPHRAGGQAQFVPRPILSDERGRLSKLMDWIRARLKHPHDLQSMAKKAAMSTRTLQRQFSETTGMTPMDWLIRERVAAAKDFLETSAKPMARVAELSGFGSEESFRRHFRLIVGVTPAVFRKQFGAKVA